MQIQLLLSSKIVEGSFIGNPISLSRERVQITSLAVAVSAIYSASVLESAIDFCSFEHQMTAAEPRYTTKPVLELRLSNSPAQSASEEPLIIISVPPKVSRSFLVP